MSKVTENARRAAVLVGQRGSDDVAPGDTDLDNLRRTPQQQ
jgi:hypothetical protein